MLSLGVSVLTGCAIGAGDLAAPTSIPGFKIQGSAHGGVYPIQGATIRLMETQSNGTWSTTTSSYTGTAKQLLQTTSDNSGYFTFPDTGWTCDAGQYAYITVSSGHTTTSTNNNVVQIGVLGGCSTTLANKSEIDNVNVFISELSTISAAYALGNFITVDNTNASSGQQIVNITAPAANNNPSSGCTGTGAAMVCTGNGLGHGFANAYNLVDSVRLDGSFPTGTARTAIPGNTASVVPQALINTMGNILQSCVDSGGGAATGSPSAGYTSDGSRCGDLFYNATPPGGTAPTNTLQVAINMAAYPNNNVASLYALQPRAVFFTPTLTSGTMSGSTTAISFTLSVFYKSTGLAADLGIPSPVDVQLDAEDNAYVLYTDTAKTVGALDGFAANGNGLFAGTRLATLGNAMGLALDNTGKAWVTNDTSSGSLYGLGTSNGSVSNTVAFTHGYPAGVAIDQSDNVWVARDTTDAYQGLFRFISANNYASTTFNITPLLPAASRRLYVDHAQSIYGVTNSGTSTAKVYHFPYENTGANTLMYSANLSATGGNSFAMNSTDIAYYPLNGQINSTQGYNNGTISVNAMGSNSSASPTGGTYTTPMGVAIDGSGSIFWTDLRATGQVFVMTPVSGSLTNAPLFSFTPCYVVGQVCHTATSTNLRGMAIDSSGAMWYVSDGTDYLVVQTLGVASPTWPLLSYANAGVIPQ